MSRKIAYLGIKGLPSRAGADRVVEAIVGRLDKEKYEITVYCSSIVVPKDTHLPGLRLVRIPVLRGKHLHATSLFLFSALHALWFGNYDLVHVHNVEACFALPLLRLRYKVISTSHAKAYVLNKWGKVARLLIRLTEYPFTALSNSITCVSRTLASEYERKYGKKVHYIPNGIDADLSKETAAKGPRLSALGLEPKGYILFAAARIMPEKGCHLLLEAWSSLAAELKLIVIGDTTQVRSYEQELKRLADNRVQFVPFISSKEDLFEIIRSSRLFVFPSTTETMSMMMLEVASLGSPLICSDIPCNSSMLPGRALYFTSGDSRDLGNKLRWALEHPEAMENLADHARSWVNENYDWDNIVQHYMILYDAVCIA